MSSFTQSAYPTQQSGTSSVPSQANSQLVPTSYTIGGVKVEFPTKAYPSQLAMMNKVIQGLKHRQNCLLESPTGSGKSLALLCAALAWQRQEAARVEQYNMEIALRQAAAAEEEIQASMRGRRGNRRMGPGLDDEDTTRLTSDSSSGAKSQATERKGGGTEAGGLWRSPDADMSVPGEDSLLTSDESTCSAPPGPPVVDLITDDEDDDDFQPLKKTARRLDSLLKDNVDFPKSIAPTEKFKVREEVSELPVEDNYVSVPSEQKLTVPKIYFGTRTHKQISQITRELRKTYYRDSRSVVLASREHTCINPVVEKVPNKNEACRELLDNTVGTGCAFHTQAKKFGNFYTLSEYLAPGYDLEDLVKAGRAARACPYFASRQLMLQADIIFCPYNYLIDPSIRKSMSIELENQIVIFDEAHNMEDAAREASSFVLSQDELQDAMQDFEKVGSKGSFEPYAHQQLANLMSAMSGWMSSHEKELKTLDFDNSGKYWTGTELMAEFEVSGIGPDFVAKNKEYIAILLKHRDEEYEKQKERGQRFTEEKKLELHAATYKVAENVFLIFDSLNAHNGRQRDDFRVALLKNTVRRRRDNYSSGVSTKEVLSLNIWCLNPAVAFSYLKDAVHSIVLTSGTLSPIQSFQSELGAPFPIKLEASHVIDRNQVFAALVGVGPNNVKLNGSYRNVEMFQYQDELGSLVLQVCQKMPKGVLCFFPSYRLLEKVSERWRTTGLWRQLNTVKRVLIEPRSGSSDFDHAINCFYDANSSPDFPQTGGMFLAVCRGKVSEGIDFANDNARAVICVGIPFPAFKDLQVELKRDYNQQNRSRGLLSGMEWYEIQAFRALNQALGRCIRHRFDWGAILLVDERFLQTPRYTQSLSKWVRNSIESYSSWQPFIQKFIEFRDNMLARPCAEPCLESYQICESSGEGNSLGIDRSISSPSGMYDSSSGGEYKEFNSGVFNVGSPRSTPLPTKNGQNRTNSPGLTIPQLFHQQRLAKRRRGEGSNW